jgi:hypothetical protein
MSDPTSGDVILGDLRPVRWRCVALGYQLSGHHLLNAVYNFNFDTPFSNTFLAFMQLLKNVSVCRDVCISDLSMRANSRKS